MSAKSVQKLLHANSAKRLFNVFPKRFSTWSAPFEWKDSSLGVEKAGTPPSNWYSDKLFYEKVEKNHTFRDWQLICRTAQLQKDGDYFATTIAGQPIVLLKDGDVFRGFYNVCRHHAAVLCDEGSGNFAETNGRITCPYHGWQYALDGRLAKAVKMKGCQNFSPKNFSLHRVPVEKLGPWLFANLGAKNSNNSDKLTSLKEQDDSKEIHGLLQKSGYDDLVFVESRTYEIKSNWKVFIDNYLDGGYHVPYAHKGLAANLDLSNYQRRIVGKETEDCLSPRYYLQTCPAATVDSKNLENQSAIDVTESRVKGNQDALYIFQYPNICINRYGAWMDTNIVYPLTNTTCVVHIDWFVDPKFANDKNYLDQCIAQSDIVQKEDVWLCERVQRGLESVAYDVGRYAPTLEEGEYMFHTRLYQDFMREVQNPTGSCKL